MRSTGLLKDIAEVDDEDVESTSSNFGSKSASSGPEAPMIAQKETRLVNRSKACVYLVILLSAALVGGLTYWFMETREKVWYEDEFEEFSEEVFETAQTRLRKLQESARTLASSWTAHATHGSDGVLLEATFNTTLPNFGVLASNLGSLGQSEMMAVAPILRPDDVPAFEQYANDHQGWITEDLAVAAYEQANEDSNDEHDEDHAEHEHKRKLVDFFDVGHINSIEDCHNGLNDSWLVTPIWQMVPTPTNASDSLVMYNVQCQEWFPSLLKDVLSSRQGVFSPMLDLRDFAQGVLSSSHDTSNDDSDDDKESNNNDEDHTLNHDDEHRHGSRHRSLFDGDHTLIHSDEHDHGTHHRSLYVEPIFSSFDTSIATIIGVVIAVVDWDVYFSNVLEDEAMGVIMDLEFSCPGQDATDRYAFEVTDGNDGVTFYGHNITYLPEYLHATERQQITSATGEFGDDSSDEESEDDRRLLQNSGVESEDDGIDGVNMPRCDWYVTTTFAKPYVANWQNQDAITYSLIVVSIFAFTALVFLMYDCLVQRRNQRVMQTAQRSNAIVSSLFPKNVADKMMEEANHGAMTKSQATQKAFRNLSASGMESSTGASMVEGSKPIADLFRDTTIMFADIAGFTAWSSMRDPGQVFTLLETIFNAFDKIADRRKVFKVETVGDCYVAVCGLPDPCKDHALVMASFARDCLTEMMRLTKQLEWDLGPDTSILNMRFGLHSGPVTAGVLRGRRARFQLFGDTVNKASRIETSGKSGRIHLSKETADLLIARGKSHWVEKREDTVTLKGLGNLNTYWLNFRSDDGTSLTDVTSEAESVSVDASLLASPDLSQMKARKSNLVRWHKEVLTLTLKKIIVLRKREQASRAVVLDDKALEAAEANAIFGHAMPSKCIDFPIIAEPIEGNHVELGSNVEEQLAKYVMDIADTYNQNPFHNVEHASHVALSVTKLLSHMESSSELSLDDPTTQFVAILTALIHDADHPGVGNQQLVKEGHSLAKMYPTSIAERHSLEVAWQILSQECYKELRRSIYTTVEEFEHFRKLLVHAVLVTDIMDKDLQAERKERWEKVFRKDPSELSEEEQKNLLNLQKTAVLETIIQVSDVSHTMQHWKVYQKWNHKLYYELKKAYQEGRAGKDPKEFWYEGELGFYDFYIIPLAERLKECPAFYTSGRELLLYAISNRKEWEIKGMEVVESLNSENL